MAKTLTATDRKALIRLASSMEKGSPERRAILAGLRLARRPYPTDRDEIQEQTQDMYSPSGLRLPLIEDLPAAKAVVTNPGYGGFTMSNKGKTMFEQITGGRFNYDTPRHHPALLWLAKNVGKAAFGSKIKVVPVSGKYEIREYDGAEWVVTPSDIRWQNTGSY